MENGVIMEKNINAYKVYYNNTDHCSSCAQVFFIDTALRSTVAVALA